MQALARAATRSLTALFVVLVVVVTGVAAIGILSTEAAEHQGDEIAGGELTTAIATNQLGRNMDATYAAGEQAALATQPATRSRLLGSLDTSLLPAVDEGLSSLEQLHVGDPPAEHADLPLFVREGPAFRNLLSLADLTAAPAGTLAAQLTAAFQPVSAHLDRLILKEMDDAKTDHAHASASSGRAIGLLFGVGVLGIAIGVVFLWLGIGRIRRNLEPSPDQAEVEETPQIANDEDETYRLLQR